MAFTRMAFALAEGRPFDLYGDGAQTRGWTYVGDVVAATVLAMERGQGLYNVGGGVEASMREAIGMFERISGRQLELREDDAGAGRPAADERRYDADPGRARVGAAGVARGRVVGSVGVGFG